MYEDSRIKVSTAPEALVDQFEMCQIHMHLASNSQYHYNLKYMMINKDLKPLKKLLLQREPERGKTYLSATEENVG